MKINATTEQISQCWQLWVHNKVGGLRLGQYIWNQHGKQGESWPELFYENDPTKAYVMAMLEVMGAVA